MSHLEADQSLEKWTPVVRKVALASRVLAVAQTRIEGAWSAYIDAVPGMDHEQECQYVLDYGTKLDERIARAIFPQFNEIPYDR